LIEKYGSGIRRIITSVKEYPLPFPEIIQVSGGTQITLKLNKVTDKVTDKLNENLKLILNYLKNDPSYSASKLADLVGISKRKTIDNINKLKTLGLIKRIGNNKSGYWEVITK